MTYRYLVPARPPLGRHHDVAGRRMAVHRSGGIGPSVVFLPAAGMVGLDYLPLHDRVARSAIAVSYDRSGTGWSEAAPLPRTAGEVTNELRDLLRAADVFGPYVLVGHALGGAYAQLYARRFPGEVGGLILLDPRLNGGTPAPTAMPSAALFAEKLSSWPADVRNTLTGHHLTTWRNATLETSNLDVVAAELRTAPPIPDVPTVMLTTGPGHAGAPPGSEQRRLDGADPGWPHVDREDEVIGAILDVIGRNG